MRHAHSMGGVRYSLTRGAFRRRLKNSGHEGRTKERRYNLYDFYLTNISRNFTLGSFASKATRSTKAQRTAEPFCALLCFLVAVTQAFKEAWGRGALFRFLN